MVLKSVSELIAENKTVMLTVVQEFQDHPFSPKKFLNLQVMLKWRTFIHWKNWVAFQHDVVLK